MINRALTYVTTFTAPKEATIYNALTGLSWGVGCILGPVVGGAFSVSSATWRWVRSGYRFLSCWKFYAKLTLRRSTSICPSLVSSCPSTSSLSPPRILALI